MHFFRKKRQVLFSPNYVNKGSSFESTENSHHKSVTEYIIRPLQALLSLSEKYMNSSLWAQGLQKW